MGDYGTPKEGSSGSRNKGNDGTKSAQLSGSRPDGTRSLQLDGPRRPVTTMQASPRSRDRMQGPDDNSITQRTLRSTEHDGTRSVGLGSRGGDTPKGNLR